MPAAKSIILLLPHENMDRCTTFGNTSNAKMREILSKTLPKAKELLERGEAVVEISDK